MDGTPRAMDRADAARELRRAGRDELRSASPHRRPAAIPSPSCWRRCGTTRWQVRRLARALLVLHCRPTDEDSMLADVAVSDQVALRRSAAEELGRIGGATSIPFLRAALGDRGIHDVVQRPLLRHRSVRAGSVGAVAATRGPGGGAARRPRRAGHDARLPHSCGSRFRRIAGPFVRSFESSARCGTFRGPLSSPMGVRAKVRAQQMAQTNSIGQPTPRPRTPRVLWVEDSEQDIRAFR